MIEILTLDLFVLPGRRWFDCPECHKENADHPILQQPVITFACKKCRKCFRKDTRDFDESDEYCPHCDNKFIIESVTPQGEVRFEVEDPRLDSRCVAVVIISRYVL